jgi:hypothetical protein
MGFYSFLSLLGYNMNLLSFIKYFPTLFFYNSYFNFHFLITYNSPPNKSSHLSLNHDKLCIMAFYRTLFLSHFTSRISFFNNYF